MVKVRIVGILFSLFISLNTIAGENDLYDFLWLDPDKSVYVLQNKIYPKDKSFYVDLGFVSNITSTFQDSNGGALRAGYHFHEEWAVEFGHIQYSNSDNNALDAVEFTTGSTPFVRKPVSSTSLFLIYSPSYGKINTDKTRSKCMERRK